MIIGGSKEYCVCQSINSKAGIAIVCRISLALESLNLSMLPVSGLRSVRYLILSAALLLPFSSVFTQQPSTATFYIERGAFLWHHADYEGAISSYTRAIEIDEETMRVPQAHKPVASRLANTYLTRAEVRSVCRIFEGAFADIDRALQLLPRWAEAYYRRGFIYQMSGDANDAVIQYSKAIDIDPRHARAYKDRGYSRSDIGDLDGALNDYDTSLKIDPTDVQAYFFRGATRSDRRDYAGAIADYSRMIELAPNNALGYQMRGLLFLVMGSDSEAESNLTKYLQLRPDDKSGIKLQIDRIKARRTQH